MRSVREFWTLLRQALSGWVEDRAASMGAALAYYTAFSLAPLLIIVIAVASIFFGRDAAQEAIVTQIGGLVGEQGQAAISGILESTSDFGTGVIGLIVGIGALLIGATTAFVELQDDLDRIWKAPPRAGSGIWNLIRSRLLSFGMVLFIGFLLTVSLALSAALAAVGDALFGDGLEAVLHVVTFLVSFAVITVLFAMIYKVLPNADTRWRDVWTGGAITALLFEIGKYLIGLYIGKSSVAASFGGAGPFVVMILWIYYSTQIFLLGAEFTVRYSALHNPRERERLRDEADSHPAASPAKTAAPAPVPAAAFTPGALSVPAANSYKPLMKLFALGVVAAALFPAAWRKR